MRAKRLGFTAALAIAATFCAAPSWADKPTSEERQARALFDQGLALSDDGKWAEALAVFQKSNQLAPSASAQFNVGATLRALGRYVEAKQTLERTLAQASNAKALKPALKKEIDKLLGEVKAKIVTLSLRVSPTAADLQMDGAPLTPLAGGQIEVDPGRHVFVVKATGYDTTTITKTVSSSDVELTLTAPKTRLVERPPVKTPVYQRAWFWTTIGVAVTGGVAVGVVFAVRPKGQEPAGPPTSTVDRIIPTSAGLRF